ncbi:hypothetical protein EMEDMD4_230054 [Sinorhizobium medicae]|uniref:Uncharacterized protein n=1 Tax=Sinorhizobium medicae TaxID=110321 RepID=A0A508WUC6_9HYPH|nr:hypothetical protein EMEDMD4_230054 [Sinorhizobium medicae]
MGRIRHRSAHHHRRNQGRDEARAEGHPDRQVHLGMDAGVPLRCCSLQGHSSRQRRPSDRGSRRQAARNDALDRQEQAGRQGEELRSAFNEKKESRSALRLSVQELQRLHRIIAFHGIRHVRLALFLVIRGQCFFRHGEFLLRHLLAARIGDLTHVSLELRHACLVANHVGLREGRGNAGGGYRGCNQYFSQHL